MDVIKAHSAYLAAWISMLLRMEGNQKIKMRLNWINAALLETSVYERVVKRKLHVKKNTQNALPKNAKEIKIVRCRLILAWRWGMLGLVWEMQKAKSKPLIRNAKSTWSYKTVTVNVLLKMTSLKSSLEGSSLFMENLRQKSFRKPKK